MINKGLDLWLAATLKAGDDTPLPWSSAEEMYKTIDSIQEGDAPFKTICFKYSGPICSNSPRWMTETYELCRDSRALLLNQIVTTDFADAFDYKPYHQFDHVGDRVWSNLMSGDWAWKEAVRNSTILPLQHTDCHLRISFPRINVRMDPCLCLLYPAATKQLFQLQQDTKNIIQY